MNGGGKISERYLSLDVFRGATVALMILVNNPGSWNHLYAPLAHANWHGCTLTDLVFPFFLFAVGNAMAFSLSTRLTDTPTVFFSSVGRRTLWIFGLGLLLNFSPFVRWTAQGEWVWRSLDQLRVMGVLQRIALSYAGAALLIYCLPRRALPAVALAVLLSYWGLCLALATGGDPYSLEGFFGTAWDRSLLGSRHLYQGEGVAFDPEGLASSLPCISQVLLGYLVGQRLRATPPSLHVLRTLLLWAGALLMAGLLWSLVLPLNKKIWTSSYVLYSSGWAIAALAALIYLLEVRRYRGAWLGFFVPFGANALFIFCLSGFLPRVLAFARWEESRDAAGVATYTNSLRWLYEHAVAPGFSEPRLGSLAYALLMVAFYWLLAQQLHRRGILLKV